ncbi:MAG TPA: hypothetical protein P5201_11460, partial [Aminobacteriaceae bacterium]|nr:hypothetical protein [Aminobacteriaceae bacterium]
MIDELLSQDEINALLSGGGFGGGAGNDGSSGDMTAEQQHVLNDIANLCERVGADVNMVRQGIGADTRIGRKFLYAGCGYGGSCFPKDVKALIKTADTNGYSMEVLKAVERVNENQKSVLFEKLVKAYQGD